MAILMKTLLLLIITILFGFSISNAQHIYFGFNGQLAIPQGEFSDSIDRLGGGLDAFGYYRFGDSPFGVGLDFSFVNFGRDTRDEPLSTTIPDLRVEVENEYNLLQVFPVFRVQQGSGILQPYLDGMAGINYFYTQTSISERGSSDEPIARDTNFEDVAFAWGGGGGLMIRVIDNSDREVQNENDDSIGQGFINLGFRYVNGNEAEYLREGSIRIENGDVAFDTLQSDTDMITVQLGFIFKF